MGSMPYVRMHVPSPTPGAMDDRISALPPETLTQLTDALDAIRDAIEPHAVELSPDERREVL